MTRDDHQDLRLRLEALVSEYAAASQRNEALDKLGRVLARIIPIADAAAAAIAEPETVEPAAADPDSAPTADPDSTT